MSFHNDIGSEEWKQRVLAKLKKERAKETNDEKAEQLKRLYEENKKENESVEVIMETILMNYELYMDMSDMPVISDVKKRNLQVKKMATEQYDEWTNIMKPRYIEEYFELTGKRLK
jgi:hypothetical protein